MLRNQEKLEEQMRDKYSVEKLFDNASAKVVKEENDLQKEDFTKPRVVQRYSQYTEQNSDIQDYTDHVEETSVVQNLPSENGSEISKGFIEKIKAKILSIFKKKEKV